MTAKKSTKPAAAPAPEPAGRYATAHTTWAAGQGEQDQPLPVHGAPVPAGEPAAPEPAAHTVGQVQQSVSMQPEGGVRDWRMISWLGMVSSDRPPTPHVGEPPPRGTDWKTTADDSPPEPAAAGSRPSWPSGVSN